MMIYIHTTPHYQYHCEEEDAQHDHHILYYHTVRILIYMFLCMSSYSVPFTLLSVPLVGMMPGGIVCGWVSDLYGGRRACVIATFMAMLVPLLLVFAFYMDALPMSTLLTLLCVMGCLVGGPNNIITSAVAADLAEDPSIQGNSRALGEIDVFIFTCVLLFFSVFFYLVLLPVHTPYPMQHDSSEFSY